MLLLHYAVGLVPRSSLLHSVAALRICSTTRPGVVYLLTAGQAEADRHGDRLGRGGVARADVMTPIDDLSSYERRP